jgi:hypothetical protein
VNLEVNTEGEECTECGEVPRKICADCGCCAEHCECGEEEEEWSATNGSRFR